MVLIVAPGGKADHRTIATAVAAAPPGARLLVRPGTYDESIEVERDLEIAADGPPGSVVIRAPEACLTIGGGTLTLRGLTIRQVEAGPGRFGRLLRPIPTAEPSVPKSVPPAVAAVVLKMGHLMIDGCTISAATGLAIGAAGSASPTTSERRLDVRGSHIHRVTGGIAAIGGTHAIIEDTEFSEWVFDAIWSKGPDSRVEVRGCRFHDGGGQAVYLDAGATGIVEESEIVGTNAAIFVADPDTEALIRGNTISGCAGFGIGISGGGRAALDENSVIDSGIGIRAMEVGSRIEATGGRLSGNVQGLFVSDRAHLSADHLEISGSDIGAVATDRQTALTLNECRIEGSAEFGIQIRDGASLVVEGGELSANKVGVFGSDAGTQVAIRGASVHGHSAPAISIGVGAQATIENNDVFDNDFPGIVTVGGTVLVLDNKVHDNRSNGIAVRDGADATVEGNELWGNDRPAITVVGAHTKARVRENTVRDNHDQGIYVFGSAEAVVANNKLANNQGAAITISDAGSSGTVDRNRIDGGAGAGIWVSDDATAILEANEIHGPSAAGIQVDGGAVVEAIDNVVEGATCGVFLISAAGSFTRNRLLGNAAGSWSLIDPTKLDREANEEDRLDVPGWAARVLDPAKYPLFALRVGVEVGVDPGAVGELGSALSLTELARRLDLEPVSEWAELVHKHVEGEGASSAGARKLVERAAMDPAGVLDHLVAHLEAFERIGVDQPSRPSPIPGIVETLSVQGPSGAGTPLTTWDGLGTLQELFDLGERHIRAGLRVSDLPHSVLEIRAFAIEGPYSGSAALLHLADWCPQVLGAYGTLVIPGNAERLIVVPVDDSGIIYALPGLVGGAAGAWLTATWKLRPVLAWLSPDRVDLFEIELGPADTVMKVRGPADLATLLARLPEPEDRIPNGWEAEVGLTQEQSLQLLPIVRLELLRRITEDVAQLPVISARTLVDLATIGRDQPRAKWTDEVSSYFDIMVNDRRELDRLTGGAPYEEVRPHLWIQLEKSGSGGPTTTHRSVADGLVSSLMLNTSGPRKRYVARALASAWGVTEAQLWEDAAANLLAAKIVTSEAGGPVRKYSVANREAEALGLLLHRLPDSCPNGHLVGLMHKGAAYAMRLDDASAVRDLARFGGFVADIHGKAAAFDDELSAHVFWLRPDGELVDLFDGRTGPTATAAAELQALIAGPGGSA